MHSGTAHADPPRRCRRRRRRWRAAAHDVRFRFTMLNVCADALASMGHDVTAVVPASELQQLASGGDVARLEFPR